jgi:hypothetical protein
MQFVNDSVSSSRPRSRRHHDRGRKHQQSTQRVLKATPEDELARRGRRRVRCRSAFLTTSMPEAIDRAVVGIGRVTEIVRSIKAFAHPDQAA